ncbi:hypothetical protein ACFU6S_34815 [Streptomyces sp. NPDC057456]|uniref:hypothetical protein n=1 Tax=Streptomyces sp. NPDC057456 TaxID=3346139 RepID=UPI003692F7AA
MQVVIVPHRRSACHRLLHEPCHRQLYLDFDAERLVVLFAGGGGLVLLGIGAVLCLTGAVV